MFTNYTATANYFIDATVTANKDLIRKAVPHDATAKTLTELVDQQGALGRAFVKGFDSMFTDGGKELTKVMTKELPKFWTEAAGKFAKTSVC